MLRPWKFELVISKVHHVSLHQQLITLFTSAIEQGHYPQECALPGTRELADQLGVNRKTIIRAFDELIAQGWLYTQEKRGTFVAKDRIINANQRLSPKHTSPNLSITRNHRENLEVHFERDDLDPASAEDEVTYRALRQGLRQLKHDHPLANNAQHHSVDQALLQWLNIEYAMQVNLNALCVIPNRFLALHIVASSIVGRDAHLLIPNNDSFVVKTLLDQARVSTMLVKTDSHKVQLDDLEKLCINYRVDALYLPSDQSYVTHSLNEYRYRLLALAERYQFYIIEDHTSHTLPSQDSLFKQDKHARVIWMHQLLEGCSTQLHLAYVLASKDLVNRMQQQLLYQNHRLSALSGLAITDMMYHGILQKYLKKIAQQKRERQAYLHQLIDQFLGKYVQISQESANAIYLTALVPIDLQVLITGCAARGVFIATDSTYHQNSIRLYYQHLKAKTLLSGIKIMSQVFEQQSHRTSKQLVVE